MGREKRWQRKVGNRPPGGCVASESLSLADNGIAKTHQQNQNALRFGRVSFADAFSAPIVGEYADVTARRSVTHLTFSNTSWRSFQTRLVS
jgi:hypothetical protein